MSAQLHSSRVAWSADAQHVVGGITVTAPLVVTVQNPPVRTVANLKLTGPITVRIGEQIVLQTDRQ